MKLFALFLVLIVAPAQAELKPGDCVKYGDSFGIVSEVIAETDRYAYFMSLGESITAPKYDMAVVESKECIMNMFYRKKPIVKASKSEFAMNGKNFKSCGKECVEVKTRTVTYRVYACGKLEKLTWKELNPNEETTSGTWTDAPATAVWPSINHMTDLNQ